MYVAGLRLGLTPERLATMTYPTLANMLDAATPPEPEGEGPKRATQEDIDKL